jgi:hypothetical protein
MPRPKAQPKSTLTHSITIRATFGSEMQRDIAVRTLTEMLAAWKGGVESRHKKKHNYHQGGMSPLFPRGSISRLHLIAGTAQFSNKSLDTPTLE